MLFITFLRNNAPFLKIFTVLAICFTLALTSSAQETPETEFHALEKQPNDVSLIDPLINLRKINPHQFKNLPKKSETNLKKINENLIPSAGGLDTSFNPSIDLIAGSVQDSATQADGKIVAGGYFKTVNGSRHDNIIRFNTDNTIDQSFNASTNGTIFALDIQPDGKIVIAGVFTSVNGTYRNTLARLNADGSLDTSFDAGFGADKLIYDIAVQPNGKIFLGGSFITINGNFSPNLSRLNADGSVDTTFSSRIPPPFGTNIPSIVYSVAVQADGKVVAGGYIASQFDGTFRAIYRFNADGTYDTSFNPGSISSNLYKVVMQSDGKFVIGGFFTTVNGVSRRYIARLNNDGSLDTTFDPGTNAGAPVRSIFVKSDGKIVFAGIAPTNGLARQLNSNGTLDVEFNAAGFGSRVNTIAVQPNGKVFLGGSASIAINAASNAAFLFNTNGSQDTSFTFQTTAESYVSEIAVQPDGKILVVGTFNRINGTNREGVARLNADGTLDTSFVLCNGCTIFSSSSGTQINSIVLQPDGKILIGGSNITAGTSLSSSLVRLNNDGSIDNSFSLPESMRNNLGNAIALRADGKFLFSYFTIDMFGQVVGGITRLNADGSVDNSFNFGQAPVIDSIVPLPDGKVLVGGPFGLGYVGEETHIGVLRLNEDGSHDRTFRAGFSTDTNRFSSVYKIALQPDGKVLVGGSLFTGVASLPAGVVRLNQSGTIDGTFQQNTIFGSEDFPRVQDIERLSNGKIIIGGKFDNFGGVLNANVARLNENGSVDSEFQAKTNKNVYDVAVQANGNILVGGNFDSVNETPRTSLARLLSEPVAPRRTRFDFDGDGRSDISVFRPSNSVWYLNNSTAGFSALGWGLSTDILAPADFDGDGKTDVAVYRDGAWYLLRSTSGFASVGFGQAGDIPQPADFDGDGKAELAVYRPSNGVWYSLNLANNQVGITQFGTAEDKPVTGDYDGDGKADLAVFRPSNSAWYILQSSAGFKAIQWGISTDKVVPADYDGDGKTDIAVYRDGVWYVQKSNGTGQLIVQFGIASDVPTAADYDGDGKADFAVFRNGVWYLLQTTNGVSITQFGTANDKPIAASFVY